MKTIVDLNNLFAGPVAPMLFFDFDGTVSKRDVIDAILEEFADEKWLEIEKEWVEGRIGSRECLRRQFDLVRATPLAMDEFLTGFELDSGIVSILDLCHDARIPVHIASDGFEYYIRRMLIKELGDNNSIRNIRIWANDLTPVGRDLWSTKFPHMKDVCNDGCATCKPAVMRHENRVGAPTIFVGDGLSDRFAAQAADVVFAKQKLASFCSNNQIAFHQYDNLQEVAQSLTEAYESASVHHSWGMQQLELNPA